MFIFENHILYYTIFITLLVFIVFSTIDYYFADVPRKLRHRVKTALYLIIFVSVYAEAVYMLYNGYMIFGNDLEISYTYDVYRALILSMSFLPMLYIPVRFQTSFSIYNNFFQRTNKRFIFDVIVIILIVGKFISNFIL